MTTSALPIEELHRHALCSILKNNRIAFEDAEDIAQDALLVYLQNQLKVDNPKAYVSRVCQNKVADKFRTEAREEKQKEKLAAAAEDPCSQAPDEYNEKDIDIKDILKIIPQKYHELFLQYKDAGFSQAELARKLEVNYNTLKSKIYTINTYIKSYYMVREGIVTYSFNFFNKHQKTNIDKLIKTFAKACKDNDSTLLYPYCRDKLYSSIIVDFEFHNINQIFHRSYKCKNQHDKIFRIDFFYRKFDLLKTVIGFDIIFNANKIEILKFPHNTFKLFDLSDEGDRLLREEFPELTIYSLNGTQIGTSQKEKIKKRMRELVKTHPGPMDGWATDIIERTNKAIDEGDFDY